MGIRKLVASLVVFIFYVQTLYSQELSSFEKRTYTSATGQVLPYRILYPKNYSKEKKYPVILFLHGAGERGNDNEKQLTHGAKLFLTRIRKTPFSIYHGDSDVVVGLNESRQMVENLKSLKANVTYKEYPGVNHNSWDNAFAEPDYLSWMFSHRK